MAAAFASADQAFKLRHGRNVNHGYSNGNQSQTTAEGTVTTYSTSNADSTVASGGEPPPNHEHKPEGGDGGSDDGEGCWKILAALAVVVLIV